MSQPIRTNDRVAIIGQTDSGKSTLAVALLQQIRPDWPVLIIDPKPSKVMMNAAHRTLRKPEEVLTFTGVARVHLATFDRGAYDPYLNMAWKRGRITIIIDELRLLIMHGVTDAIVRILVAGRERLIGCWSLMQRPVKFLEAISEAEWVMAFNLQLAKDRDRLEERGVSFENVTHLKPHEFVVHRKGWDEPIVHEPIAV